MEWEAEGYAPSEDLKTNGFQPKDKPPAGIFNYFFNRVFRGLKELQDASNEDAKTLGNKVDKEDGKGLSTNDYDDDEKAQVRAIPDHLVNGLGVGSFRQKGTKAETTLEDALEGGLSEEDVHTLGSAAVQLGRGTKAKGIVSFTAGMMNTANDFQAVFGKYAKDTTGTAEESAEGSVFVIGAGTGEAALANAFRVSAGGRCYGSAAFLASGADYAEYMEWLDRNPHAEDRRGRFVTLEGDKIRIATAEDDYILGIVSADPSVVGNTYSDQWHGMYLTDVFGEKLTQTVDVPKKVNEYGDIIPAHTEIRFVLNPDYDPEKEYVGRDQRPEWAAVGTHGQLVLVDDGTCEVNGYCKAADGGIATKSEIKTEYRVIKRIDDTHVRVYVK